MTKTTTQERIEFVKRRIEERKALSGDLRRQAFEGAYNGASLFKDAQTCEDLAEGMTRALAILFP